MPQSATYWWPYFFGGNHSTSKSSFVKPDLHMFSQFYSNKRVLVTGHTGFKGSWLCEWLLSLGAEVCGVALPPESDPSLFSLLNLKDRIRHVVCDIRDSNKLQEVFQSFQPEVVFHLAAQALVRKGYDFPRETFEVNGMGSLNVLEACVKTPSIKTAVFITSDKCYENKEWEFGYRETDTLGGHDPYSASKAVAEVIFSCYARSYFSGPQAAAIATVRAGNVIGGGDWAIDRIIPDCVRSWSEGKPAVLRSPASTRPWQHVLEPLSGYLALGSVLLQRKAELTGTAFNFGPPVDVNVSVQELVDELKKTWHNPGSIVHPNAETQKKECNLLKLCCDKALAKLAWKPVLEFREVARMTAEWYADFYSNNPNPKEVTQSQIRQYATLARERRIAWSLG